MYRLFGRRPPVDIQPAMTASEAASMQLIDLRNKIDALTRAALYARKSCDLAIDMRRAANLPMPTAYVRPAVPVVPGPDGERRPT